MHVRQADGSYGVVAKLVVVPGAMWMYNLTVANDHTYTVGIEHWIVHNCGLNNANLGTVKGFGASLYTHKDMHGWQVGARTDQEYNEQAINFMSGVPKTGQYQIWNATTGQYYRWDSQTGMFGIYNPSQGRMVSYYNIGTGNDAEEYFAKQYWATGSAYNKATGKTETTYSDDMPTDPDYYMPLIRDVPEGPGLEPELEP